MLSFIFFTWKRCISCVFLHSSLSQKLLEICNLADIERKLDLYKNMFYTNTPSDRNGNFITSESLKIELIAGGLNWKQQQYIMEKMEPNDFGEVCDIIKLFTITKLSYLSNTYEDMFVFVVTDIDKVFFFLPQFGLPYHLDPCPQSFIFCSIALGMYLQLREVTDALLSILDFIFGLHVLYTSFPLHARQYMLQSIGYEQSKIYTTTQTKTSFCTKRHESTR